MHRTVRKRGLILHSMERMPKMQFSMARKFMLQPLRRCDGKPKKPHKCSLTFEEPFLEKTINSTSLEGALARAPSSDV
jgi:hypothetical protein